MDDDDEDVVDDEIVTLAEADTGVVDSGCVSGGRDDVLDG